MDKTRQNFAKCAIICLLLGVLVVSSTALARPRNGFERGPGTSEKGSQREQQRRDEASAAFPEVNDALKGILEKAAKNQRPESETLKKAQQTLDNNRRHALAYDDSQKAGYMLLQAWTEFYEGDLKAAVTRSIRASRTDSTSQDAWISQTLFSLLSGKTPMQPRTQKPKPRRGDDLGYGSRSRRPRRGLDETMSFTRREFRTFNGLNIEYEPGQDTLCILFWQSDGGAADANDVPGVNPLDVGDGFGTMNYGTSRQNQKKVPLENQQNYVMQMAKACEESEHVKFVQINTNTSYSEARKAVEEFASHLEMDEAVPLIIAAESGSGAEGFVGLDALKPFMLIIDKEGLVKYAGPAADFMPAFILTELTGVEIDLEEYAQSTSPGNREMMPGQMEMPDETMKSKPARKDFAPLRKGDPFTEPAADPNQVAPKTPTEPERPVKPSKPEKPAEAPELSPEDRARAEKLLQSAKLHIEQSRKLRAKNPKQGIEDARKVLKEYPNTEYAQRARQLLRRVPYRWKERHGITDEEQGL